MIVRFDSLNRFERPNFILCNPGSTYNNGIVSNIVGALTDTSDEEIVFNFNSTSELNLRVTKSIREDTSDNQRIQLLYRAIQNRRLVFVENIGYFMVTNVKTGYSGSFQCKDIQARSVDCELEQKMVPYIEDGTYKFMSDGLSEEDGLIEKIVKTIPLWTIGHVDTSVANRYRTFEDVDTNINCLEFMLNNMQDAYECIFLFDIVNRTINVYDQSQYIKHTDIYLTSDDIINNIDITEDSEDLYTALTAVGGDNISIAAVNPTGTNTIYNFDNYLDWMSGDLSAAVSEWQTDIAESEYDYYNLNLSYYTSLQTANDLQLEINKINTQLTMYRRCKDNIIASSSTELVESYNKVISESGGIPISILDSIQETIDEISDFINGCQSQLDETMKELDEVSEIVSSLKDEIAEFNNRLAITNVFSQEQLNELSNYIFEGEYSDEYVVITDIMSYEEKFEQMKTLYDRAKIRLHSVSTPTQSFDIDVENFLFQKEFEHFSSELETGCIINTELNGIEEGTVMLFLSGITVNYDDRTLSLTFGNRLRKLDTKSLFDSVLGDVKRSANTIDYIKDILHPIKNGEFDAMKSALQSSRDITMGAALSSDNEEVIIDSSGYTGRQMLSSGVYDPHQIKITGKSIVFTDDSWESSKTAIGELVIGDNLTVYGVNAQAIIGDLIMGNDLHIMDSDGNDLMSVVDGRIYTNVTEFVSREGGINDQIDALDDKIGIVSSSIEQTASNIVLRFKEDELEEYIRFQGALIELGKRDNAFMARLSNERLSFLQDGSEIAYISNNKLYITGAEIRNKLTIGTPDNGYFDFIPRNNGNLSIKWREY